MSNTTSLDALYIEHLSFANRMKENNQVKNVEGFSSTGAIWITDLQGEKTLYWSYSKEINGGKLMREGAY